MSYVHIYIILIGLAVLFVGGFVGAFLRGMM